MWVTVRRREAVEDVSGAVKTLARWTGRMLCVAGLVAWLGWLGWRISSPIHGAIGVVVLGLELVAFVAALVVSAALWRGCSDPHPCVRPAPLPVVLASALGLDDSLVDVRGEPAVGADDTGEVAWARRGLRLLVPGEHAAAFPPTTSLAEAAWSVVAIDGLRRMLFVAVLVIVLFTGQVPFEVPPWVIACVLAAGLVSLSLGHCLLTAGRLRPGDRLRWSMASIGAGMGDGTSRTGLPIRWAATMASMVVLNLAVSLRGVSDRWTHGLGTMSHDERVVTMALAIGLVVIGLVALRTLPQPVLGFYGATRRLEEGSARRLALGGTMAVALVGFVAGAMPAPPPI
jgi:hypothetical protein